MHAKCIGDFAVQRAASSRHKVWVVDGAESSNPLLNQCPTCKQLFQGEVQVAVAQARVKQVGQREDLESLDAVSQLGKAHLEQKRYSEALTIFHRVLDKCEASVGPGYHLVGTSQLNIGHVYQERGRATEALRWYRLGLATRQESLGKDHPHVGIAEEFVGMACETPGLYDEALQRYQSSLSIQLDAVARHGHGPAAHMELAVTYGNLGNLFRKTNKPKKALKMYEKARSINFLQTARARP